MGKLIRRMALWALLFFLLSCLGMSVAMRFFPQLMTQTFNGVLAAVFAAAALVVLLAELLWRRRSGGAGAFASIAEAKRNLKRWYPVEKGKVYIPDGSHLVMMPTNLLAPHTMCLLHYCWKTTEHLVFFPQWDSIEAGLDCLACLSKGVDSPQERPRPVYVPLKSIEYFAQEEPVQGKGEILTLLRYRGPMDESIGLVLHEGAYSVLQRLLPRFDLRMMKARQYPHSSQQISDITQRMQQLKELRMQSLISEDEYHAKKAQLLTYL